MVKQNNRESFSENGTGRYIVQSSDRKFLIEDLILSSASGYLRLAIMRLVLKQPPTYIIDSEPTFHAHIILKNE